MVLSGRWRPGHDGTRWRSPQEATFARSTLCALESDVTLHDPVAAPEIFPLPGKPDHL